MFTIDPSTGRRLKSYREHSAAQIELILTRAQIAFAQWHAMSLAQRGARMKAAAKVLRKDKAVFAKLMAMEMGKPIVQGEGEIEKCAWVCEFYAENAKAYLSPEPVKTNAPKSVIAYEPLGTVLAVMPWNFPFWQVFRCAAPILMAGNAIVLKHASNVAGCALAIEGVFKQADFPTGLLGALLIDSDRVNKIIAHPLVHAVTLTGSTGAGKAVAAQAGSVIKKSVLELGGSDAYIVLKDADIARAAAVCAASRMINGGQSCVAAKRFIVARPILKEFQELFITHMTEQQMGLPLDRATTLGPMARHDLRDQVHAQVQASIKAGAVLLLGGRVPQGPGAFYPPTVLGNVRPGMPAYSDEIFGPVASIISASDAKDAVRIANDSVFGLGAAIFTRNAARGRQIALTGLQAGCIAVNGAVQSDPRLPFGGIKLSGYGRELGSFGIREFTNIKSITSQD